MTPDQARQINEAIGKAKDALWDALKIAEHSSDAKLACQIGAMCGRAEVLQRKAQAKTVQKPLTLRQFARQHKL